MRRLASAVVPIAALALLACAEGPTEGEPDAAPDVPAPRVELGTGDLSFVALPETDPTLELVHGPQGGYHVHLSVRLWQLAPDRLSLTYQVVRPGGAQLARVPLLLDSARFVREGDHLMRYGDLAILDIATADDVVGDTVIVRVSATAADGASATDERTVTIVDAL